VRAKGQKGKRAKGQKGKRAKGQQGWHQCTRGNRNKKKKQNGRAKKQKQKFPFLYKDLDSIDLIFLTYSLCISYLILID
jgi:hypothetical protein